MSKRTYLNIDEGTGDRLRACKARMEEELGIKLSMNSVITRILNEMYPRDNETNNDRTDQVA